VGWIELIRQLGRGITQGVHANALRAIVLNTLQCPVRLSTVSSGRIEPEFVSNDKSSQVSVDVIATVNRITSQSRVAREVIVRTGIIPASVKVVAARSDDGVDTN